MNLQEYVIAHTERGECKCGNCCDVGTKPDPTGHTADLLFFKVATVGKPSAEEFKRLTAEAKGEFGDCDPLDGKEHNYLELGRWIGDQGLAMQYMGLGSLLGVFQLLTPMTMLRISADTKTGNKGWALALEKASSHLYKNRLQAKRLRAAIALFREKIARGEPWPTGR